MAKSNPRRPCYRCGVGIDHDKDGHCGICARMTDEEAAKIKGITMPTAYDHLVPFQRLNYWLRQHIGELNEEISRLTSEKKMWDEAEVRRACANHYSDVVSRRKIDVDASIQNLSLERRKWENLLTIIAACSDCNGYGRIREIIDQDESSFHVCAACNGTGKSQLQGA